MDVPFILLELTSPFFYRVITCHLLSSNPFFSQLLRREEKITLIVDGYTASAVLRDNVDYQTNHALYLGGDKMPDPLEI